MMQSLFNVFKNWTIHKIIYNYIKLNNLLSFSLKATEAFLEHSRTFMLGLFGEKN